MKFLYAIFFFVLNYLVAFFLVPLVYNIFFHELNIINNNTVFLMVNFLKAGFVLFVWFLFVKYYKQFEIKKYKSNNIKLLYLIIIVILPTFIFLLYKSLTNQITTYNNISINDFFLFQLAYFTFIPLTEELVYREILYKILIKENVFISSIFISILFSITHIGVDSIDIIYLLYIFINGMVLFLMRYKKKLLYSIISHSLINIIMFIFQYKIL